MEVVRVESDTVNSDIVPNIMDTPAPYWLYFLALVLWPLFTALPAFLVALTVAFLLVRLSTKRLAE